jgi:hypothetical protein
LAKWASFGAALLLGAFIGVVSGLGMLAVVASIDATAVIPASPFERQEAIEYAVGAMIATIIGSLFASAIKSRVFDIDARHPPE